MKCKVFALFTVTGRQVKKPIAIGYELAMSCDCAYALMSDRITSTMIGARVVEISANGLVIQGIEKIGDNRLILQRWWCSTDSRKRAP